MSQKFCNILITWGTIRSSGCFVGNHENYIPRRTVSCRARLILSKCYSARYTSTVWNTTSEYTVLWFIWPCQIVAFLATQSKFLELSINCIVINCVFTILTTKVFDCFRGAVALFEHVMHKSQIRLCYIFAAFKLYTQWSHAHRVQRTYYIDIPTTADIIHGLNFFGPRDIRTTN